MPEHDIAEFHDACSGWQILPALSELRLYSAALLLQGKQLRQLQ